MQVQSIAECSKGSVRMLQGECSAILSTFIKPPFVIKIFVLYIFEWPFYTGFTVCSNCKYLMTQLGHVLKCIKPIANDFIEILYLNLCMLGNFSSFCCCLTFSKTNFQEHYQCQMVWIQIRTDMSVLIWIQIVCTGYQQTTKVNTSMERVKEQIKVKIILQLLHH